MARSVSVTTQFRQRKGKNFREPIYERIHITRQLALGDKIIPITTHLHRYSIVIVLAVISAHAYASQSHRSWCDRNVNADKILLPEDPYAPGNHVIRALHNAGFPFDIEKNPPIKGKDIVLVDDPDSSTSEKVWREVPRKESISLLSGRRVAGATEVLMHYCEQLGYRISIVQGRAVALPTESTTLAESITCGAFSSNKVTLGDIYRRYNDSLAQHKLYYLLHHQGTGLNFQTDMQFSFSFEGGQLIDLLCTITNTLDSIDPRYYHCWSIHGTKGSRLLSISRMDKRKFEKLTIAE